MLMDVDSLAPARTSACVNVQRYYDVNIITTMQRCETPHRMDFIRWTGGRFCRQMPCSLHGAGAHIAASVLQLLGAHKTKTFTFTGGCSCAVSRCSCASFWKRCIAGCVRAALPRPPDWLGGIARLC